MQVYEKIRLLREMKGWSQEEMAHHLDMSASGYGGMERGETDIPLSRLQRLAKVFEISLRELFDLSEKSIFYVGNDNTLTNSSQINSLLPDSITLQQELEKYRFFIEQKDREIQLLQQQNTDLRVIIELLQKEKPG
jgi:transcriptional regulator with XRE-family HTH domain